MKKRSIWQRKWLWPFAAFLSLAFVIHAQDNSTAKESAKFGVGIAYGFKDQIKQLEHPVVHPVEFTLRYNFSPKHSIRINVPLGWRNHRHPWGGWSAYYEDYVEGCDKQESRLYGLGIGYDYLIATYKNLDLIAGGGLEYQRFCHLYERWTKGDPTLTTTRNEFNDFSIYPQAGLRYTWKFVGVEVDYRCYFTLRGKRRYYSNFLYLPHPMKYGMHINHAFRCGLFFLF